MTLVSTCFFLEKKAREFLSGRVECPAPWDSQGFVFNGCCIWEFPKIGVLQNGWFILENPIRMDLGVFHCFRKQPYHVSLRS